MGAQSVFVLAYGRRRVPKLAPLEPQGFLNWYWEIANRAFRAGYAPVIPLWGQRGPPTVAEFALWHEWSVAQARRWLVSHAAWHRKQQRLGRPW